MDYLRCEVDWLVHFFDLVHSYSCSQPHLSMPKVIPNVEYAIGQDAGLSCGTNSSIW